LSEIQTDLLFANLQSIIPKPIEKQTVIPSAPSSDIILNPSSKGSSALDSNKMTEGSGHVESIDSTDWQPSSLPALRIEQPGGSDQLLIRIITLRRSTDHTSKLFEVLEEENLDVLHSHRSSTKEKVLHTVQVKVLMPSKLDIDGLRSKLDSWAAKGAE
jgi:hypothetical protein